MVYPGNRSPCGWSWVGTTWQTAAQANNGLFKWCEVSLVDVKSKTMGKRIAPGAAWPASRVTFLAWLARSKHAGPKGSLLRKQNERKSNQRSRHHSNHTRVTCGMVNAAPLYVTGWMNRGSSCFRQRLVPAGVQGLTSVMYTWFATKKWNQTSTTASAPCSVAMATSFDAHSWPGPKRASWACSTLSKIPRPAAILACWAIASFAGFGLTSATPSKMPSLLRGSCWAKSTEVSMDFSNPTVLLAFATSFAMRLISLCFLSCT